MDSTTPTTPTAIADLNEIERGQLCQSTIESLYEATGGLRQFPGLLKKIIRCKAWERRDLVTPDGRPKGKVIELASLRELITEKPLRGWGEDPKKVEAVIRDDPEALAMFREAMNGTLAEHGANQHKEGRDIVPQGPESYGTNAYWQSRIQRDCPEELQKIKSGEKRIIDVRRERGWLPKSKRITTTGDPKIDRQRLLDAWGEDYLEGLQADTEGAA